MDMQHINRKKYQNEMPHTDEGWWEAVLAEEQQYSNPRPPVAMKPKPLVHEEKTASSPSVQQADWDLMKRLYTEDRIIEMKATGHNRGGLLVEHDGLAGFIPFSHLVDLAGKVTNITDFGVFVDLGGVEGLIHISELSWGRVSHPNQIVKLGEEIQIQVLEISVERSRVALSLKRLIPNPWEHADVSFAIGSIVSAVITTVLSYGAFARLDAGVEGLIHISEMPLRDNQGPRDLLIEGQRVQVRVLQIEPSHQRLGFSMQLNHE